jgi:dihydropteroate synthase
MHTRARPKVKEFPHYDDVVADVVGFLRERVGEARRRGVRADALVVDPGPDFGKTPAQTIRVLQHLPEVAALGYPVLVAVARKDFVGALTHRSPRQRLAGTLAAVGACVGDAPVIVRVHDVWEVRDFLTVQAALRGDVDIPDDLALPAELRREPG